MLRLIPFALMVFVGTVLLALSPDSAGFPRRGAGGEANHISSISFGTPYRYNQGYPTETTILYVMIVMGQIIL